MDDQADILPPDYSEIIDSIDQTTSEYNEKIAEIEKALEHPFEDHRERASLVRQLEKLQDRLETYERIRTLNNQMKEDQKRTGWMTVYVRRIAILIAAYVLYLFLY